MGRAERSNRPGIQQRGIHLRGLWTAFLRVLILLLLIILGVSLFLSFNPGAMGAVLMNLPGVVIFPDFGPVPEAPEISAPAGELPTGQVAFSGEYDGISFACSFLLQLADGRRVGISSAHASPGPIPGASGVLLAPDGSVGAHLSGQIVRGSTFLNRRLSMDYALWSIADDAPAGRFLTPDPRGQAQPGERIRVFGRFLNEDGGSKSWPGVVMAVTKDATWIQLDEVINPNGFSGCPVVSQHTGQVIGMSVAGSRNPPTRMGLHTIGSLVEKVEAATASQKH